MTTHTWTNQPAIAAAEPIWVMHQPKPDNAYMCACCGGPLPGGGIYHASVNGTLMVVLTRPKSRWIVPCLPFEAPDIAPRTDLHGQSV